MRTRLRSTVAPATALLLGWVIAGIPGRADELPAAPDTSDWNCSFCPYPEGWYGELDLGLGAVHGHSPKFSSDRGFDQRGLFPSLGGEVRYLDRRGDWLDLRFENPALDSRRLKLRGGRRGRYGIRVDYREISRYQGTGTHGVHIPLADGSLALPANWVRASDTGGLGALPASLRPAPLATHRRWLEAGIDWKLSRRWHHDIEVQHMEKTGTRAFGAGVFTFNSSHFPIPLDHTTDRLNIGLHYAGSRGNASVQFSTSHFDNGVRSVRWENPFTPVGRTATLRAALEPDSDFSRFAFTGAFRPRPGLRLSGRAEVGRIEQDTPFLPYSINPDFADLPLPRVSLDGRIETGVLNLASRLNARLGPRWTFSAQARYEERDNRSPADLYTPVITDLVLRPPTASRPYSFRRGRWQLQTHYRAGPGWGFSAGMRRRTVERSLQSVAETEDDSRWGELRVDRLHWAQLRLRWEQSDRSGSPYETRIDPGLPENPLLRKFNLADRRRDRWMVDFDLLPSGHWGINLSYYESDDRYGASVLGLLASDERSLGLDWNLATGRHLELRAFASRDALSSRVAGGSAEGTGQWNARTQDRFTTYGAGLSARPTDRIELRVDYVKSGAKGRIATRTGRGETPFPELLTDLRNIKVYLRYRVDDHWGWIASAERERYSSTDWQVDGLGNAGIPAILTLGPGRSEYHVTIIRLLASYRF